MVNTIYDFVNLVWKVILTQKDIYCFLRYIKLIPNILPVYAGISSECKARAISNGDIAPHKSRPLVVSGYHLLSLVRWSDAHLWCGKNIFIGLLTLHWTVLITIIKKTQPWVQNICFVWNNILIKPNFSWKLWSSEYMLLENLSNAW